MSFLLLNITSQISSQTDWLLLIFYILIALVFSFVCSIAEAVLLSITPSYIEHLKVGSPKKAKLLKTIRINNIDRSLAAILTLNTIAHTVGAIVAGAKATVVFGSTWIGLFSALMTLAILFFSEIIPKTIGAVYWQRLAQPVAVLVNGLIKLLYPLIWVSEGLTKLIARNKQHSLFSRDEFLAMAGLGKRTGDIDEYELRIIGNLLKLSSLKAKDIMTPRRVVQYLSAQKTVSESFDQIVNISFSRIPVFNSDVDDATHFVLKSDLLMANLQQQGDKALQEFQRPLLCVLDEMPLPKLFELLLTEQQHIALVVNEYGDTRGLVTLEDLLETLLGLEIVDEFDQVQDMQQLARKQWLARAKRRGLLVEEVEELMQEKSDQSNSN
ncbi:MAG: DUF21 domain-containing protein [Kangiellaceae bacterium]|nr:DUF21 domain-containing protein [Kangiellaceae bacterium]